MTYGTKLRQSREKIHLSQQQVADFLGIAQNTYSLWESDKTTFRVEYLPKLAELFKVDILDLIPQDIPIKNVNRNIDSSVVEFEIQMSVQELYKDFLENKNELIRLLKNEVNSKDEKIKELLNEIKNLKKSTL